MKRNLLLITTLALFVLPACAGNSYVNVKYQLPTAAAIPAEQKAGLAVADQRTDPAVFAGKAAEEFEHFTGLFSLTVAQEKGNHLAGAFELTELFKEALKRRLEKSGITILPQAPSETPVINIGLTEFHITLEGRTWKAVLGYQVELTKEGQVLTTQTISGQAERAKIVGHGDAEKLLGEIFSDMVNRLDTQKLFKHPDL